MQTFPVPTPPSPESPCPAVRAAIARARALCPFPELLDSEVKDHGRILEGGVGDASTMRRAAKLATLATAKTREACMACPDPAALAAVRAANTDAAYALARNDAVTTAIAAIDALAAANEIISQGRDTELRRLWASTVGELAKLRGA